MKVIQIHFINTFLSVRNTILGKHFNSKWCVERRSHIPDQTILSRNEFPLFLAESGADGDLYHKLLIVNRSLGYLIQILWGGYWDSGLP